MSIADHLPGASSLLITVNGLPAHPLIVHAAVVFGPLAVLGSLAYLVPRWRDRLRWPVLVTVVVALVSIWAAYLTGLDFRASRTFFQQNPQVARHAHYAQVLRWVTTGFAIVAIVVTTRLHAAQDAGQDGGQGAVRVAARGLLAVLAVVTLVYVFLTGDAGAKAVFPPVAAAPSSVAVSTR